MVLELVLVGVVGLLAGLGLGYALSNVKTAQKTQIENLQAELASRDEELANYRAEVVNQFAQTAEKFKNLDDSYHALHQQLATTAVALCGDQATPLLTQDDASVNTPTVVDEVPVAPAEAANEDVLEPQDDTEALAQPVDEPLVEGADEADIIAEEALDNLTEETTDAVDLVAEEPDVPTLTESDKEGQAPIKEANG